MHHVFQVRLTERSTLSNSSSLLRNFHVTPSALWRSLPRVADFMKCYKPVSTVALAIAGRLQPSCAFFVKSWIVSRIIIMMTAQIASDPDSEDGTVLEVYELLRMLIIYWFFLKNVAVRKRERIDEKEKKLRDQLKVMDEHRWTLMRL